MPYGRRSVYRFIVRGYMEGQQVINVHHRVCSVQAGDPATPAELTALLNAVKTKWDTHILPLISERYRTLDITAKEVESIDYTVRPHEVFGAGAVYEYNITQGFGGILVATGDALPIVAVVTTQLRTGLAGRNWHGSMRLSGFTEATAQGSTILDTPRLVIAEAVNSFLGPITTNWGGAPTIFGAVIYSKTEAFEYYSQNQFMDLYTRYITSVRTNKVIGTQYSRKIREEGN